MKKMFLLLLIALSFISCKIDVETSPQKFTVRFDSDGGSQISSQKIEKGLLVQKPENPTKENYDFVGWYIGKSLFDFSTPITSDITLKAKWSKKSFTVTFDSDGGSEVTSQIVEINNTATKPKTPEKKDCIFGGWFIGGTLFDFSTPITSDIVLKAKWNKKSYTVTFDPDGGSEVTSQVIEINNTATEPKTPEKKDCIFGGWFIGETLFDFSTPITSDIVLKAKWNKKTFTVTFDADGGSDVNSQVIEINNSATKPENPTKDDYEFLGWYIEESLFDFSTPITSDITLKAKWNKKSYTVTFDSEGGSDVNSQVIEINNSVTEPKTPEKKDCVFCGWFIGETLFDFSTPITSDIVLKAKWNKKSYTVIFDSDGGSDVTAQVIEINNIATKPEAPAKTGYVFLGWYNDETPFNFSTPVTSVITLTAKWKPNEYTIVFDKTSGSGQDMQNLSLIYDEEKSLPQNLYTAPIGMKFAGWTIDSDSSSTIYNDEQTVKNLSSENNSIITLYAVWIDKAPHSIWYRNVDFTDETIDNSENPTEYLESQKVQLKDIERYGYTFDGWYTDSNYSDNSKIIGWNAGEKTSTIILFAKWTPIKYTITYEGVEGVENPNATTYTLEDKWYLQVIDKPGYYFYGWKYGEKRINNISDIGGGDVTLTADMELIEWAIDYVFGKNDFYGSLYNIEQDITLIIPNKIGYNFAGWYENENFDSTENPITGWKKGEKTGIIGLYAKWEPKTYKIIFDSCGGTTVSSQVISYNSVVTEPEVPVYNDYNFMGWYFDSEKTIICDFSKPFVFPESFEDSENVTLYAKWGKMVYVEGATLSKWWEYNIYDEKYYLHKCDSFTIPNLYLSDHEITQLEYTKYCSYSGKTNDKKPKADSYKPVTFVSWNDAIVYCNLRSIAEGLTPAYSIDGKTNPAEWRLIGGSAESKYCGSTYSWDDIICDFTANGYRLPKEKEWEYIAREGSVLSDYIYSGSNNIDDVGWYKENSSDSVHYGKCKAPNALEIYDMTGNVHEWCWETDDENHYPYVFHFAKIRGGDYSDIRETPTGRTTSYLEISASVTGTRLAGGARSGFRVVRTASE